MKFKYLESKNSNKLDMDKYYTPYEIMRHCVNKTIDVLSEQGYCISEYLEPSAGEGVFSNYLKEMGVKVRAFDILPEADGIESADYLEVHLDYIKNRCVIGNPPYGSRLSLANKFFKKSIKIADYVSFILPISQLSNKETFYQFDLIHSEDLGEVIFSGNRKVHCCLNIYVRPSGGLNKKSINKLKDVEIVRQDSKKYDNFDFDIRMCYWGNGTAGKILSENESYSGEYKIKIHNEKIKNEVVDVITNTKWKEILNSTAMCRIKQYHIVNLLREKIEGIE